MKYILTFTFFLSWFFCFSQTESEHKLIYKKAFEEQISMLEGKKTIDFKKSVFLVENAFNKNSLNYQSFCSEISALGNTLKSMIAKKGYQQYKTAGNWATFTFMTDTIPENNYQPYIYDFDDFYGKKDFTKQFVTKLMKTKGGNCHSLPFLYKILCNEIGFTANLALAPNHCYIKHPSEKGPWTNVEMTNASFPRDQWLIKSMSISVEAIKQGVYMSALTAKEEIAFTMFDLSSCYARQFGYDDFYLKICNSALKFFPSCLELCMNKSNGLYSMIEKAKKNGFPDKDWTTKTIADYKNLQAKIDKMGFKEMTQQQYDEWMKSVEKEKMKRQTNKSK